MQTKWVMTSFKHSHTSDIISQWK